MRLFDFSSWQSIATTLFALMLVTLVGVGIRLVVMMTIQQRRERMNRQINERLKTLISAYKVLGGSFTGDLVVDPRHLRDMRRSAPTADSSDRNEADAIDLSAADDDQDFDSGSERPRRIRDAVEAALSDIILLGTEAQVRLAAQAARELAAGRPVPVHDLVIALRNFIREALDLDPVPADVAIPQQGPTRPGGAGGRGGGNRGRSDDGGQAGGRGGGRGASGGGGSGGGMGLAGGMGMVGGVSLGGGTNSPTDPG